MCLCAFMLFSLILCVCAFCSVHSLLPVSCTIALLIFIFFIIFAFVVCVDAFSYLSLRKLKCRQTY